MSLAVPPTVRSDDPVARVPASPHVQDHTTLAAGTRLGEFEILRVLGIGGFGIVYLAFDRALDRQVAIKEYMPASLASRNDGVHVTVRSTTDQETFGIGLRSFINEAKLLASFDHPSLVKVYHFWEEHGTAYMVMQYYPGRTLKEERRAMSGPPQEAWLRRFVEPLLGALEALHGQDVYHRDIAPDNIILLPDGRPILLDFGAARRVISDRTQALTAILKPNFAPVEQYADVARLRQGPWTDIYALGAVLRFMLTAEAPLPAVARAVHDELYVLADPVYAAAMPGVSLTFLKAVDWAMAVLPKDRPQSVQALRSALCGDLVPPPAVLPREETPPSLATPRVQSPSAPAASDLTHPATIVHRAAGDGSSVAAASPASPQRLRVPAMIASVLVAGAAVAGWSSWERPNDVASAATASPAVAPIAVVASATQSTPPPANAATGTAPRNAEKTSVAVDAQTRSAAAKPTSKPAVPERIKVATTAAADKSVAPAPAAVAPPRERPSSVTAAAARSAAPASAATPGAPAAAIGAAAGPRELCSGRSFLATQWCISMECAKPQHRQYAECVQLQRAEASRREADLYR
jgi:serine/threonine protein kinase